MPLMWEHRFDFPLFYYYNDPEEIHPFEGAQFISSIAISDVLKRYEYEKEPQDISLLCVSHNVNKPKFFYPEGNENYPSSEHVRFNQVVFNGSPLINLNQNSGSPFSFWVIAFLEDLSSRNYRFRFMSPIRCRPFPILCTGRG